MSGAPLTVGDVTVRFGGLLALDRVSFDVKAGSILGVIGPNGAGKTTLFDAISGLTPVQRGSVRVGDRKLDGMSPHDRAMAGLGRSFQDGRLFPSLTVEECISVALVRHIPAPGIIGALTGGPSARTSTSQASARTAQIIRQLGLESYADTFVRDLSTGTRRIVDLACAVAHAPSVLLLDEPSSGIARTEVGALASLIGRIREETECTMILIEHDIPLVSSIADELLVLETGRVLTRGVPDEVIEDERVIAAYFGTEASKAPALSTVGR